MYMYMYVNIKSRDCFDNGDKTLETAILLLFWKGGILN